MRKFLQSIFLAVILTLSAGLANAADRKDGPYVNFPGQVQAGIVSSRLAFANTDAEIDLGVPCTTVCFFVESGQDLHVNWANGTATTSNAKIVGGTGFCYQGPPIQKVRRIGSGNGNVNVVAW